MSHDPTDPDRPMTRDPATSPSLPSRLYVRPEAFALERTRVFEDSWHVLGHRSQLKAPGEYLVLPILDQEILVMRDGDTLRAFYNVCSHRASPLLSGRGHVKVIVCPVHCWSYDRSGNLLQARACDKNPRFERKDHGLKAVKIEEFCGFIWVNLNMEARSVAAENPGLEALMRSICPDLDELTLVEEESGDLVHANWKVLIENSLECGHCPSNHARFWQACDGATYFTRGAGNWNWHGARMRDGSAFGYAQVYPYTELRVMAGSVLQRFHQPRSETQTFTVQRYFLKDPADLPAYRGAFSDDNWHTDKKICEDVQRGLRSRGYRQGRFMLAADDSDQAYLSEACIHRFHLQLATALGVPIE